MLLLFHRNLYPVRKKSISNPCQPRGTFGLVDQRKAVWLVCLLKVQTVQHFLFQCGSLLYKQF
jgi:hypothetical protein